MQKIHQKGTLNLKCYIIQNGKVIEFDSQKERTKYLNKKLNISRISINKRKTPFEIGITEFGNIINGEYIKQNINILEPQKEYFVTMNRKRYYGSNLKQLANKININYALLIQWFNGNAAIDIKFRITKIGYIQNKKTTYLEFETTGTQYYIVIDEKTFIYNNLAGIAKKLKMDSKYISKLLCGVRTTNKCSEIGYYIDGEFIKSEKSTPSEYEKYVKSNKEKLKVKNKNDYEKMKLKENTRMLQELKEKNLEEFINIPLYKKERDLMATKIGIKNNKGIAVKWPKIKKLLIESGLYEVEYKAQVINKERKDYVIINIKR